MSHLLRSHAPITDTAWALIDEEAKTRLTPGLAARRLVDFSGPLGWDHSATNLGRVETVPNDGLAGVTARRRRVLPLVELKSSFSLDREELLAGDRGAEDVDLDPVALAAIEMVEAENKAVFHGNAALGFEGIVEASTHPEISSGDSIDAYPAAVAQAVEQLLRIGIGGPYGLALGREDYTAVVET
ncbi:MAG: family 1 encapsulin nanocompartment shell protein, partial [Solirubrobacteraceae bacterium]